MGHLDCQACGACCTFGGDVMVDVTDTEVPRHLTRSVRNRMGFGSWEADEGQRVMARRGCDSCSALSQKNGAFQCRIYDVRPAVCREFEAGSQECLDARELAAKSA